MPDISYYKGKSLDQLQKMKDANSQDWHGASRQEQDALHAENVKIQSVIDSMTGSKSGFDSGTGKWSTTPGQSSSSSGRTTSYAHSATGQGYTQADLDAARSEGYNLYQEQMRRYEAEQERARREAEAAKKAAVGQAVLGLEGQKTDMGQQYDDLYRQLYIDRRMAERKLPQQLAAMGYNGGLTESSALDLQTGYRDALRQGEQARIAGINDIDQAIANARLTGDISIAEQAAQMTLDKLNAYGAIVDKQAAQLNADRNFYYQAALDDRDFTYRTGRDQAADQQWQQSYDLQLRQMNRQQLLDELNRQDVDYERRLAAAQYLYEQSGDPEGLKMLGYTDAQIAALGKVWQQNMLPTGSTYSGSGGGGGSTGGLTGGPGSGYRSIYEDMQAAGLRGEADAYAYALNKGYNSTEAKTIAGYFTAYLRGQGPGLVPGQSQGVDGAKNIVTEGTETQANMEEMVKSAMDRFIRDGTKSPDEIADWLLELEGNGSISKDQRIKLAKLATAAFGG